MTILNILTVPNLDLKKKCSKVEKIDDEVKKQLDDMLETMYDAPGIGLAAPQVGLLKRMVVIDVSKDGEEKRPYKMINPVIIEKSTETDFYDEGCLSVPDQYASIERAKEVTVQYTDENGKQQTEHAKGLFAICIQHELDHLDGKVFIDYLSQVKRDMIIRRVKKMQRK
ncbi:MAG: peptide deformylase [Alphaproteobacteria bacterium]|nr:peptide deformylase [Alphaproteobacteria bacterium]